jgi:AcrR family transcriptional regulator
MGSKASAANAVKADQSPSSLARLSPGPGMLAKDVAAHQLARIHDATVGIVAERGYQALKVRDVVGHAEVSTRAFYEHFRSKDDCFLRTYESISRRATRRIISAQVGEVDWRRRARLALEEFVRQLKSRPDAARLTLLEAYVAGEEVSARARQAERTFEGMLVESLARPPRGVTVPPLIVEGMVAGVISVSRSCLHAGSVGSLHDSTDQLVEWALGHVDAAAAELPDLDRRAVWRDTTLEPLPPSSRHADAGPLSSTGDRALILSAVADLAARRGYAKLTAARVRSAASVSRRKFDAHFDDLEDCYLAALEQHAGEALAQATRAQAAASSWSGGVYRAIAALDEHIAGDAFLAKACLSDDFPPGPNGARSRHQLIDAAGELLEDAIPGGLHSHPLIAEASLGAIWSLCRHHLLREGSTSRKISASLAYLALVPSVAASDVVDAIKAEQAESRSHKALS